MISVGDFVRLNSNGPVMLVTAIDSNDIATVIWNTVGFLIDDWDFPVICLKKI